MSEHLERQRLTAAALRRLQTLQRNQCMDATKLDSRPTEKQLDIFKGIRDFSVRAIVAGNQASKSSIGGREISWLVEDCHPFVSRKDLWGDSPLIILVLGQVGEQIESNLWSVKIKPFLTPGSFREVRIGNALQRVEFIKTKDRIIFVSHHNCNEARKTVQGYAAHYVWIDEMPTSLSLVAELVTRIISKQGRLLITFTPLLRSVEIRQYIESLTPPIGKLYRMNMLDNPIFAGREAEILAQFASYPEAERRARLYGDWFVGSLSVYDYDPTSKKVPTPKDYTKMWKHVEAVDPAASSKFGYCLFAQSPATGIWYLVKAKYIDGAAPSDLVERIKMEGIGYNIVRRISDPHETWFIYEACKRGLVYEGVYKKSERKMDLIKKLQEVLSVNSLLVVDTCDDFFREITECSWSEQADDKIVNSSKFHLLDAAQYGVDILDLIKFVPPPPPGDALQHFNRELREANNRRKERIKISKGVKRWGRSFSRYTSA